MRIQAQQPPDGASEDAPAERHAIAFRKHEVLTREWRDPSGRRMALLDFQVAYITNRQAVAIAKYGDAQMQCTNCFDIYAYVESREPGDPTLELLCHDNRPGRLTGLKVEYQNGQVYFNVERELADATASRRSPNTYSYRYTRSGVISPMIGDFYAAPDK